MKSTFVLEHGHERHGQDDVKLIGVYATEADAQAAAKRLRHLPGFRDWPDGFAIDEYEIGKDHWTEGFVTVVSIHLPSMGQEGKYYVVHGTWRPGDVYELPEFDDDIDPSDVAFSPGDQVLCEERDILGSRDCLVVTQRVGSMCPHARR